MNLSSLVLTTALTLGLMSPAAAIDDLHRYAALFNQSTDPIAFEYNAPIGGFGPDSAFPMPLMDIKLAAALLHAEGVDPVTGVDFSRITSSITLGLAPNTITILHGEPGYADDHVAAISGRGFDRHMLSDIPVYARGADNSTDFDLVSERDAFGYGMGMAQRLANADDDLIITRNWATMENVLALRNAKAKSANPWSVAFDALADVQGDSHLEGAMGWQDAEARKKLADFDLAPYRLAIFSQDVADGQLAIRVTMVFDAPLEDAATTLDHSVGQIESLVEGLGELETTLTERGGFSVTTLSILPDLDLPGAEHMLQQLVLTALDGQPV